MTVNKTFINLVVLNLRMRMRSEVKRLLKIIKPQQVQLIDCFKDPCLQQQLPHQKSNKTPINNTNLSLLISSSSHHEINNSLDSISLHLSLERVCDLFDSTYTIKRHNSEEDDLKNSRYVDDPVCNLLQEPLALSSHKPNSLGSLTGSDLDFLEDKEQIDLKNLTSFSIFGNNNINNDSSRQIRTTTSLTPSLMSDCSSSPFTEAEDDINKGFFDDIEFPPKFGIPNNLHPASTPSNPSSLPSSELHKPIESFACCPLEPSTGLSGLGQRHSPSRGEDQKDQKDQKANSKEDIRTSRGKSKVRLESEFGSDE
ncbi:hypothetical protein BY996DRAFT_8393140 [Phakopsora pachyrhizi]|nr:hypothetical protein BY996DRAFT_8393140 [Phakopsora pachyrhizi]